jgi:hypothetical protein
MTIDVHLAFAPDVTRHNSVLNLRDAGIQAGQLSAASWVAAEGNGPEAMSVVLKSVHKALQATLPQHVNWLLVGDSTWQPDTRVVRHHGLWNALKSRNLDIPLTCRAEEALIEARGRLKYFGAAHLSVFSIDAAARVMHFERCAYVASMPPSFEVQALTLVGWTGDFRDDGELVQRFARAGGLLFKRYGEFDDPEVGLVGVGSPEVLKRLAS